MKVAVMPVGDISFPTGLVVVTDPGFVDVSECKPLSPRTPVGRWPADVAVARDEGSEHPGGGGTVAAMRVRFMTEPATHWVADLTDDEGGVLGIGVDAGRIAIFDRRVLEHATAEMIDGACFGTESQASIVDFPRGSEMFVSDAGKGDGSYPVWWGVSADGELAEIVVEFDVLVRSPTWWITIPAELLDEEGSVMAPELAVAGVSLQVISADEVRGPWTWDYSSWPAERRPEHDPPAIGLALRLKGPVAQLRLLDAAGEWVGVNPGGIGPHEDGSRTEYWEADVRLSSARTLALQIVGELEPLPPPP